MRTSAFLIVALAAIVPAQQLGAQSAQQGARADSLPANTAQAPTAHLADFERRRAQGRGRYITPEQLAKSPERRLVEMLERLGGLRTDVNASGQVKVVAKTGPTSISQMSQGTGRPGFCEVALAMNGVFLTDFDLGSLHNADVDAVEYYTPAATPAEFRRPGTQCGVLLIWQK